MADYLLPENSVLTISEKQKLFAIKNRMITIPGNFPKSGIENKCQCGMKEDMQHIYMCEIYNKQSQPRFEYMRIYSGSISEQIKVFRQFETNLEIRELLKNENFLPCYPHVIRCSHQSIVMG